MHLSQTELSKQIDEAKQKVEIGGIYRHYKNPDMLYKVKSIAITEADDKLCVIYEAQYGANLTFVRSITSWLEFVEVGRKTVPRFTKI